MSFRPLVLKVSSNTYCTGLLCILLLDYLRIRVKIRGTMEVSAMIYFAAVSLFLPFIVLAAVPDSTPASDTLPAAAVNNRFVI